MKAVPILRKMMRLTWFFLGVALSSAASAPDARAETCGGAYTCEGTIAYIYISWTQKPKQTNCEIYDRAFKQTGIPDVNSIQELAGRWQLWQQDQIEAHIDQFADASLDEGRQHQGPCSTISGEPSDIESLALPGARVRILGYRVFTAHSPKHSNSPFGSGPSELLFALVQVESD